MALLTNPSPAGGRSADSTVRLWDLTGAGEGSVQAFHHHTDKVQALQWHPTEAPVLLSAGFDRLAAVVDVRAPEAVRRRIAASDTALQCRTTAAVDRMLTALTTSIRDVT